MSFEEDMIKPGLKEDHNNDGGNNENCIKRQKRLRLKKASRNKRIEEETKINRLGRNMLENIIH